MNSDGNIMSFKGASEGHECLYTIALQFSL